MERGASPRRSEASWFPAVLVLAIAGFLLTSPAAGSLGADGPVDADDPEDLKDLDDPVRDVGDPVAGDPGIPVAEKLLQSLEGSIGPGLHEDTFEVDASGILIDETLPGQRMTAATAPCPEDWTGCPWSGPAEAYAWMRTASLDEVVALSREVEDAGHTASVPAPDAFPGYGEATEPERRAAWIDWWSLLDQGPMREGTASPEGLQESGGEGSGEPSEVEEGKTSEMGKPRNVRSLWSLQAHGEPVAVHPWGESGHLVMTELGVFHFSSWEEPADWMVRYDTPLWFYSNVGKSEVVETGEEEGWLVVEFPDRWGWGEWNTIQVIDLSDGSVVLQDFIGEQAVREWTLSDVTEDGTPELLVLDFLGEWTVRTIPDGDVIHRMHMRDAMGPQALAMAITGYEDEYFTKYAFGDGTGDGVQDLFVVRWFEASVYTTVVTLYDGRDQAMIWESVVELEFGSPIYETGQPVIGDLTGDSRDDIVIHSMRQGSNSPDPFDRLVTGVAGADGTEVFHDSGTTECPLEEVCPEDYEPVAVVPSTSGARVVGLTGGFFVPYRDLVVRSLPAVAVAGLPTTLEEEVPVELPFYPWTDYKGRVYNGVGDDAERLLVTPFMGASPFWHRGIHTGEQVWVFEVTPQEVTGHPLEEPLSDLFLHPVTGQATGWFAGPDHWAPLSQEFKRDGTGQRLLVDVGMRMWHDADDDRVPDALVRKTNGYLWLSGKNASVIRDVDLEPGASWRFVIHDGARPVLFELREGEYRYGGLEDEEPDWTMPEEVLEDYSVWGVQDYTGDGQVELFLRKIPIRIDREFEAGAGGGAPGAMQEEERESWMIFDPRDQEAVWEFERPKEADHLYLSARDVLERAGLEILVSWSEGEDERIVQLHVITESSPRWEWEIGESQLSVGEGGYMVLFTPDEEEAQLVVDVHRVSDRSRVNRLVFDPERPLLDWLMIPLDEDREEFYVVYSYGAARSSSGAEEDAAEQRVRVVPVEGGTFLVDFPTGSGALEVREDEEKGERVVVESPRELSYLMGTLGDWSGSGVGDLVLNEADHMVVRSSTSGDILAVAPDRGNLCCVVDLNDDDRYEFGMMRYPWGQLRMYAFDGEFGELEEPDEEVSGRVSLRSDENETKDLDAFFEPEESPGPAALVLVLVVGGWVAIARASTRRRR